MPHRFVASSLGAVTRTILIAGTQSLKVTSILYGDLDVDTTLVQLRRVTDVTSGLVGYMSSLDDPASSPLATVICGDSTSPGGTPAWTQVARLGNWRLQTTASRELLEGGPIEVGPGQALMLDGVGGYASFYFEE